MSKRHKKKQQKAGANGPANASQTSQNLASSSSPQNENGGSSLPMHQTPNSQDPQVSKRSTGSNTKGTKANRNHNQPLSKEQPAPCSTGQSQPPSGSQASSRNLSEGYKQSANNSQTPPTDKDQPQSPSDQNSINGHTGGQSANKQQASQPQPSVAQNNRRKENNAASGKNTQRAQPVLELPEGYVKPAPNKKTAKNKRNKANNQARKEQMATAPGATVSTSASREPEDASNASTAAQAANAAGHATATASTTAMVSTSTVPVARKHNFTAENSVILWDLSRLPYYLTNPYQHHRPDNLLRNLAVLEPERRFSQQQADLVRVAFPEDAQFHIGPWKFEDILGFDQDHYDYFRQRMFKRVHRTKVVEKDGQKFELEAIRLKSRGHLTSPYDKPMDHQSVKDMSRLYPCVPSFLKAFLMTGGEKTMGEPNPVSAGFVSGKPNFFIDFMRHDFVARQILALLSESYVDIANLSLTCRTTFSLVASAIDRWDLTAGDFNHCELLDEEVPLYETYNRLDSGSVKKCGVSGLLVVSPSRLGLQPGSRICRRVQTYTQQLTNSLKCYRALHLIGGGLRYLYLQRMPFMNTHLLQGLLFSLKKLEVLGVHQCPQISFFDTSSLLTIVDNAQQRNHRAIKLDFYPRIQHGPRGFDPKVTDADFGLTWTDHGRNLGVAVSSRLVYAILPRVLATGQSHWLKPNSSFRQFLEQLPLPDHFVVRVLATYMWRYTAGQAGRPMSPHEYVAYHTSLCRAIYGDTGLATKRIKWPMDEFEQWTGPIRCADCNKYMPTHFFTFVARGAVCDGCTVQAVDRTATDHYKREKSAITHGLGFGPNETAHPVLATNLRMSEYGWTLHMYTISPYAQRARGAAIALQDKRNKDMTDHESFEEQPKNRHSGLVPIETHQLDDGLENRAYERPAAWGKVVRKRKRLLSRRLKKQVEKAYALDPEEEPVLVPYETRPILYTPSEPEPVPVPEPAKKDVKKDNEGKTTMKGWIVKNGKDKKAGKGKTTTKVWNTKNGKDKKSDEGKTTTKGGIAKDDKDEEADDAEKKAEAEAKMKEAEQRARKNKALKEIDEMFSSDEEESGGSASERDDNSPPEEVGTWVARPLHYLRTHRQMW